MRSLRTPLLLRLERQRDTVPDIRDERTVEDLLPHAVTRAGVTFTSRPTEVRRETTDDD
jgi:hypothetical protein